MESRPIKIFSPHWHFNLLSWFSAYIEVLTSPTLRFLSKKWTVACTVGLSRCGDGEPEGLSVAWISTGTSTTSTGNTMHKIQQDSDMKGNDWSYFGTLFSKTIGGSTGVSSALVMTWKIKSATDRIQNLWRINLTLSMIPFARCLIYHVYNKARPRGLI